VTIEQILTERRSYLLPRWHDLVVAARPGRGGTLGARAELSFSNPTATILKDALAEVYDRLASGSHAASGRALDRLMRLRALDRPELSEAVAFLAVLHQMLRHELAPVLEDPGELSAIEARIAALTTEAAAGLSAARQLLADLRVRESDRRTAKLTERFGRATAKKGSNQ
jgi:hypothetical protein